MFEKNLNELIKGIRAHKGSEAKYIESAVGECKKEIKSKDLEIKAQAILKLTYVLFPMVTRLTNVATNVWVRFFLGFVSGC